MTALGFTQAGPLSRYYADHRHGRIMHVTLLATTTLYESPPGWSPLGVLWHNGHLYVLEEAADPRENTNSYHTLGGPRLIRLEADGTTTVLATIPPADVH
jgi:hypothetical protein